MPTRVMAWAAGVAPVILLMLLGLHFGGTT
jgi:hypothetical protein